MVPKSTEVDAVRRRAFQRMAIPLPNRLLLTMWADRRGAVHLTVSENASTLKEAVLEAGRVGNANGPTA